MTNKVRAHKIFETKPRRFRLESLLVFNNEKHQSADDTHRVAGYGRVHEILEMCDRRGRFRHMVEISPTGFGRVCTVMYRLEYKGKSLSDGEEHHLSYGMYLKMGKPEVFDVQTKYTVREKR